MVSLPELGRYLMAVVMQLVSTPHNAHYRTQKHLEGLIVIYPSLTTMSTCEACALPQQR
jgi:hypothetical protein